jgi:HD-GYP domain-containing protein (c-di-GMP phosphodiesterase class II)
MFHHLDTLGEIDKPIGIAAKLKYIHGTLTERFPCVARIAVALYDPKTDLLKTFVDSSGGDRPLAHYDARLCEAPSLREIIRTGKPRVVNDLAIFNRGTRAHTRQVAAQGYRASYTMPIYSRGELFGFLFLNSYEVAPFSDEILQELDLYGHLIALSILNDLTSVEMLLATVKTARDMGHLRDDETGAHQDRMSRYARLIASKVADKYGLTDEYVEKIFLFAPLHDIGKLGISDTVLLKPDQLSAEEYEYMKTHTTKGRELIDQMLGNFNLATMSQIEILRNIAEFHHETIDGNGYPVGLKGAEIPIEARIVAVADIFDALTNSRPYKHAWTNEEALTALQSLAGVKLDAECVAALANSREEIGEIQRHFVTDRIG